MPSNETHEETYQKGLQVRREVLGAEHVDRSVAEVSDFVRPVQELVTEYCWGIVWSREGLPRANPEPVEHRHADGPQPAPRTRGARPRRADQRRHRRRDPRDAAAGRDLRRRAGRARVVPHRRRDLEGATLARDSHRRRRLHRPRGDGDAHDAPSRRGGLRGRRLRRLARRAGPGGRERCPTGRRAPGRRSREPTWWSRCCPTRTSSSPCSRVTGFSPRYRPTTLVVDMSSSEPLRTRALAERLGARRVRMIDAPVSGGVAGAEHGALMVMAGGPPQDVEEARPLLEVFGRVVHAGPIGLRARHKGAQQPAVGHPPAERPARRSALAERSGSTPRSCCRSSTAPAVAAARRRTSCPTSSSRDVQLRVCLASDAQGHEDRGPAGGASPRGVRAQCRGRGDLGARPPPPYPPKPTTRKLRPGSRTTDPLVVTSRARALAALVVFREGQSPRIW